MRHRPRRRVLPEAGKMIVMSSSKYRLLFCLLSCLIAAPAAFALSGTQVASDNVKARLVSEVASVAPAQTFWVALELDIRDGWHTYWRNPGDSGEATRIDWQLPAGFKAGDIVWATPHRFDVTPLANYGYAKHAVHLIEITAPAQLPSGKPLTLAGKASWLVCSDVCIPESADLSIRLPTGVQPGAVDPASAGLFATARADLPSSAPAAASAHIADGKLVIALGKGWGPTLAQIKSLAFFPYAEGAIEYAAPQTLTRSADGVQLDIKLGYAPPSGGSVDGVLVATEQNGNDAVTVPMEIAATFTGGMPPAAAGASAHPAAAPQSLLTLMWGAILGGLILNLMPCVFPVLSIKAMHLVEQAKTDPRAVQLKGLVFAAGVIASMLCLVGVLLALRAGGEQLGWGFQLQSPLFVTLMVYLLLAIGLNLSGVFEIGGNLAGMGDTLTHGDSWSAAFFTGVLTTLVATPCTAPFMGAAVGAALTQSPFAAVCIFFALGFGLSLPFLTLSFVPNLRRWMPRPGAWMDTLKQVFAFPIYASAAWLLWVLAQETSSAGLAIALGGVVLVGLAAWAYQKSKVTGQRGRITALATAVVAILIAVALPVRFGNVANAAPAAPTGSARAEGEWQPYSAARVAEITAKGEPLLVNFTASWCLTCLVNERNAFADAAVQKIFHDRKVTLMKGDWTNRDPAITAALAAFGRAGVPLYVVYNARAGAAEPVILPQILTASVVENTFSH